MRNKKQKKEVQKKVYSKYYDYALAGIFFLFVIFFSTTKLTNEDDYFWHMATGRYIVETKTIPSTDPFSFSTQGLHWFATEWGWDVLTYYIFQIAGYAGLTILTTLVFLLIYYLSFKILQKFNVSYILIFIFFTLHIFGVFERITPRPHIITYLIFTVQIFIILNYKFFNREKKWQLYLLPLIYLLWANMHMGCMIGLVIFAVYLVSEIIVYFKPGKFVIKDTPPLSKNELITVIIVFVTSGLTMLINPHGIMTYMYAVSSQSNMKMLQEAVMEWLSPFNPKLFGKFHSYIYLLYLAGGFVVIRYALRKKDLFALSLVVLFGLNSLRALRFAVDYLFVINIYLITAIGYYINNLKDLKIKEYFTNKPVLKLSLCILLLFLIANIPSDKLYHSYLKYARFSGIGLDSNYYPVKMFDFIKENNIQNTGDRPFNTFECGGYFLWSFPGKQNFFDGRDLNNFIMNEYQEIYSKIAGFEKKVDDYKFDYAICVVPDIMTEPQIMKQTVLSYFAKSNDKWKLVWWNDRSLLFVRNEPKFAEVISKYEYKYITPFNFAFQKSIIDNGIKEDRENVKAELKRKLSEEPRGYVINNMVRAIKIN
jgi:hypothetical protein